MTKSEEKVGVARRLARACSITDNRKGLFLSAVVAWGNFAFLYWAVTAGSDLGVIAGLSICGLSCGLAAYFG